MLVTLLAPNYCGVILQTVLRPVGVKGMVVLPKRWIVERTFAWMNLHCQISKDYGRLPKTASRYVISRCAI
jgi:transposase